MNHWYWPLESSLDVATLRGFIAANIENYEQLETLLLLRRRARSTKVQAVASELKLDAEEAHQALRALVARKLVAVDSSEDAFRYSPRTEELSQGAELLALAYEGHRLKLIQLMNANALERARMAALRTFAQGFRLGGPKKDG